MAVPVLPVVSTPSTPSPRGVGFSEVLGKVVIRSPTPRASRHANAMVEVAKIFDHVRVAQGRLDRILALAQDGRTFTPAELLAMQGQVYGASQQIDLASRIVEKGSAGVKQVLQTQP